MLDGTRCRTIARLAASVWSTYDEVVGNGFGIASDFRIPGVAAKSRRWTAHEDGWPESEQVKANRLVRTGVGRSINLWQWVRRVEEVHRASWEEEKLHR